MVLDLEKYDTFKAVYIPNKIWSRGSVVVPDTPPVLNEDFLSVSDLFRSPELLNAFVIKWEEYGVKGLTELPGEFNYCI